MTAYKRFQSAHDMSLRPFAHPGAVNHRENTYNFCMNDVYVASVARADRLAHLAPQRASTSTAR